MEIELLDKAVLRAADGSGALVLIRGEAGIGKSTLLTEFVSRSRKSVHVLSGQCDDLITPTPLAPFWDMTDEEPELQVSLEQGDSHALSEFLLDVLNRSLRPTVVVIDDVHWADQGTLDVIRRIGRRIDQTHGLLVLAFRDEETSFEHPLRAVIGDVPVRSTLRIRLEPFTRESIAHLAHDDEVEELLRLTGGNPLLVTEAIDSPNEIPQSIADMTRARLDRLSNQSRVIVELASVVPGSCERDVAEACVPFTTADLDESESSGLLRVSPGFLTYRHELIRRAVEGSLTEARRIELNETLLGCLEQREEKASRLVHHAQEAGNAQAVVRHAPAAARDAAQAGAHREAVAYFETLSPDLDRFDLSEQARLLEDWSSSTKSLGDISTARELRVRAEDRYREIGDAVALGRCLTSLSVLHWRMNHHELAFGAADEAVDLFRTSENKYELGCALVDRSLLHCYASESSQAQADISHADQLAADITNPTLDARVAAAKAWSTSSTEESFELAMDAVTKASRVRDLKASFIAYRGIPQIVPKLHPVRWGSIVDDALEFAEENGDEDVWAFACSGLSQQHLYAGRLLAAEDAAREAAEVWSDITQNLASWPLSIIALAQVRRSGAQAQETLTQLAVFPHDPPWIWGINAVLAEAHWLCGDTHFDARAALDELELALSTDQKSNISELSFWLWKLGLLTEVPEQVHAGHQHQVEGDWRAAAEVWNDWERPYAEALALYDGDTEARLHALSILDNMGGVALAAKIRRELRDEGVTGVPSGPRTTTRENKARLTERQADVLGLMAEGLTNHEIADRLFISSRTVEHHVSAILSKLDAPTRKQAVEKAQDLGVLTHT